MEKDYLYAKKIEIIKMFERINKHEKKQNNFDNSSKVSNKVLSKVIIKSKNL